VMSGPAASWGLVNRYCAETSAQLINEQGGWSIGGEKYRIEVASIDDRNDPKVSVAGAERLAYQEKIKYIIGPNVDTTAAAIVPVMEKAKAINIPYAFSKSLYTPPRSNSILGMIASYQAGPVIYKYLKTQKGVRSVSFIARNESDPLNQRTEGVAAAKALGLTVAGAGTAEIRSEDMDKFVQRYTKVAGEWNDEAGTKVYALEMILRTLALAGPKAISDVEAFKKAIPTFQVQNPFLKEAKTLKFVGAAYFSQPRQIGVPMVVNVFEDGKFRTLFIGSV